MRRRKQRRRGRWIGQIKRAIHRGLYADKALVQSDKVVRSIMRDIAACGDDMTPNLTFYPPIGEDHDR